MRLLADTSGIIAAIVTSENHHLACRDALNSAAHVSITPSVITETHYLLSASGHTAAATAFLSNVADGFYDIESPATDDIARAMKLIATYDNTLSRKRPKPGSLDLADALNIVAAARVETTLILTLDQDYRMVTPLGGPPYFTLVPFDWT